LPFALEHVLPYLILSELLTAELQLAKDWL
jgi:hypothetical protein